MQNKRLNELNDDYLDLLDDYYCATIGEKK